MSERWLKKTDAWTLVMEYPEEAIAEIDSLRCEVDHLTEENERLRQKEHDD